MAGELHNVEKSQKQMLREVVSTSVRVRNKRLAHVDKTQVAVRQQVYVTRATSGLRMHGGVD